ncbi:hypothetical protein NEF87_000618 [Candidatus Lokiarchaeum ossiferum]|uniref:MarR family transcriptional regulator n=1 Tax=Candidatus Lokiarchaeum ossiferum TaxID=2951803 RepID=A0ABY6HLF0_9ARCH|nr:hypothetical protein NEF87_000618 [Candidatus Lokiarchaeum sp. B-35]
MSKSSSSKQRRLNTIEKEIVSIMVKNAKFGGKNVKFNEIFTYLLLYGKLTQLEFQKLTGFSKGTVSMLLPFLCEIGITQKKLKPKTHAYEYFLKDPNFRLSYNIAPDYFAEYSTFKKKMDSLVQHLNEIVNQKTEDEGVFLTRINEFNDYIGYQIMKRKDRKEYIQNITIPVKDLPVFDGHQKNLSPKILELEQEIINMQLNSTLLDEDKPIYSTILAYFITRRSLTQANLQELTQFSSGIISQNLKILIDRGFITKLPKAQKSTRQNIYIMQSILYSFHRYFRFFMKSQINQFPKIRALLEEVESMTMDTTNQEAILRIKSFLNKYCKFLEGFEHYSQLIFNECDQLSTIFQY